MTEKTDFSADKLNDALKIWGQGEATGDGLEAAAYWIGIGESYYFAATEVIASGYTTNSIVENVADPLM